MNPGQIIGLGAASVAFLCFVGLLVAHIVAPPPDGQHARRRGRHRDHGETHEGAGGEGHVEELHKLGVDPLVSLLHREDCCRLDEHVTPIGFDADEPTWDGEEHGESDHPDAVADQCMCGHPRYHTCPDWASGWESSDLCHQGEHGHCNGIGLDREYGASVANTCPCGCHAIPLSAAIKQLRLGRRRDEDGAA